MSLGLSMRRFLLGGLRDRLSASGDPYLEIYTGTIAPDAESAPGSSPILVATFAAPAFALDPVLAEMVASGLGYGLTSGLPTWARLVAGDGVPVDVYTAGLPGSGAQVTITDNKPVPSNHVYIGGELTVSLTLVYP